jgi:hypothetical protein
MHTRSTQLLLDTMNLASILHANNCLVMLRPTHPEMRKHTQKRPSNLFDGPNMLCGQCTYMKADFPVTNPTSIRIPASSGPAPVLRSHLCSAHHTEIGDNVPLREWPPHEAIYLISC